MIDRYCAKCSATITLCNGFVKAGDILTGRRPVRELCGTCAHAWEWTADEELVRMTPEEREG